MYNINDWDNNTVAIWNRLMELDGIGEELTPKEFLEEMKSENNRVLSILESGILSQPTVGLKGLTNYFIINDIGHGGICSKCNTDGIVVLLMDKNYTDNLDMKVFLPSLETYMIARIDLNGSAFSRMHPVPINPHTDYWYCPNCKELHKFDYDQDCGLICNMEVVKL